MKRFIVMLLFFGLLIMPALSVRSQEFGRIKAMQKRAETVTRQKNHFVAMVLQSYHIPHEMNARKMVTRIQMKGQWHDVSAIEIVPLLSTGSETARQVTAHEICFFTKAGVLTLVSSLTIP